MRRWLFNLAAAVSLVMAAVLAGLWVRSERGEFVDLVAWHSSVDRNGWQSGATLTARRGYIAAWAGRSQSEFLEQRGWVFSFRRDESDYFPNDTSRPPFFGVSHRYTNGLMPGNGFGAPPRPYSERYLAVPSPLLIMAFLIGPSLWWMRRRRVRQRSTERLCPTCGYDLRATPDRCRECGAVPGAVPERGL